MWTERSEGEIRVIQKGRFVLKVDEWGGDTQTEWKIVKKFQVSFIEKTETGKIGRMRKVWEGWCGGGGETDIWR